MIIRLELTGDGAEVLRDHVDGVMAEIEATDPEKADLSLYAVLKRLRTQLGGKRESVKSTRGTLRSARRVP